MKSIIASILVTLSLLITLISASPARLARAQIDPGRQCTGGQISKAGGKCECPNINTQAFYNQRCVTCPSPSTVSMFGTTCDCPQGSNFNGKSCVCTLPYFPDQKGVCITCTASGAKRSGSQCLCTSNGKPPPLGGSCPK